MSKKDEPAFPVPLVEGEALLNGADPNGLSKREYFAAMAMQGLVSIPFEGMACDEKYKYKQAARGAVRFADALIKTLSQEPRP